MKFDQETIKMARQTDLVSFLMQSGYTLKKEGKNHRVKEFSGLLVKDNMYTDFVNGHSGNSIDFCQRVLRMTFHEAVQHLVSHEVKVTPFQSKEEKERGIGEVTFPEKANNYKRVFAYLNKTRGIPVHLIQELVNEKLLYQDKNGNAVFICRDENGEEHGAIIRGTLTDKSFKQRVGSGEYPIA